MSYIFVDFDEARRCAALMDTHAAQLGALIAGESVERREKLEEFLRKLQTLATDLSEETELFAAADEKLKALHLMTNEGGRVKSGE